MDDPRIEMMNQWLARVEAKVDSVLADIPVLQAKAHSSEDCPSIRAVRSLVEGQERTIRHHETILNRVSGGVDTLKWLVAVLGLVSTLVGIYAVFVQ